MTIGNWSRHDHQQRTLLVEHFESELIAIRDSLESAGVERLKMSLELHREFEVLPLAHPNQFIESCGSWVPGIRCHESFKTVLTIEHADDGIERNVWDCTPELQQAS